MMNTTSKHKRAILIWLAIYPLITILFFLTGDFISAYPLALRTFMLTVIAVPMMVYVILPFYSRLLSRWLNKNQ